MNDTTHPTVTGPAQPADADLARRIDREAEEVFRRQMEIACWFGAIILPAYSLLDVYTGKRADPPIEDVYNFVVIRALAGLILVAIALLMRSKRLQGRKLYVFVDVAGFGLIGLLLTYIIAKMWVVVPDYYIGLAQLMMARCVLLPGGPRRAFLPSLGLFLAFPVGLLLFADSGLLGDRTLAVYSGASLGRVVAACAGLGGCLGIGLLGSLLYNRMMTRELRSRHMGRYLIGSVIGHGGMGTVYRAWDSQLDRTCAMKVIRADKVDDMERVRELFDREARKTSQLQDANVIEVYDYGENVSGDLFYVMAYLEGLDILKMVRRGGPIEPERVIHLAKQACSALGGAHRRGLVHLDIKPANLFVTQQEDNPDFLKVLDFGLVRAIARQRPADVSLVRRIRDVEPDEDWREEVSRIGESQTVGGFEGTPAYAAPEQIEGGGADERSDIYALGGVMYYMLTGVAPYGEPNQLALMYLKLTQPPVPPGKRRPRLRIPPDLDAVVARCLAVHPADRYATMGDLRAALENCADSKAWDPQRSAEFWATVTIEPEMFSTLSSLDGEEVPGRGLAAPRVAEEPELEPTGQPLQKREAEDVAQTVPPSRRSDGDQSYPDEARLSTTDDLEDTGDLGDPGDLATTTPPRGTDIAEDLDETGMQKRAPWRLSDEE